LNKTRYSAILLFIFVSLFSYSSYSQVYEINGSPFATEGAPLPQRIKSQDEKVIIVDPATHVWGAYAANGALVRWGIATAGADECSDSDDSCRTNIGEFRIYSLGNSGCASNKYDNAPMPYCMFFNGGQAIHGSSDVQFNNVSHGCIRLHIDDAKWLRYEFAEGPARTNNYLGTKVIIKSY